MQCLMKLLSDERGLSQDNFLSLHTTKVYYNSFTHPFKAKVKVKSAPIVNWASHKAHEWQHLSPVSVV